MSEEEHWKIPLSPFFKGGIKRGFVVRGFILADGRFVWEVRRWKMEDGR